MLRCSVSPKVDHLPADQAPQNLAEQLDPDIEVASQVRFVSEIVVETAILWLIAADPDSEKILLGVEVSQYRSAV